MRFCVIIPTYNNEKTIKQVVEDVRQKTKDVIVVNDGSTDSTHVVLEQLPTDVSIIAYPQNRGKGYALLRGFRYAREKGYTHAVTIDADGQHFADDIDLLLNAAADNPGGIILGSRNLTEKNMPRQNTFANKFSNLWFKAQTGITLPDTQSGFRLYTLNALHGLRLITSRYEAELELMVFAAWAGEQISSVPIRVYYPPAEERVSHFRPVKDFLRIFALNTILCVIALIYGYPSMLIRKILDK